MLELRTQASWVGLPLLLPVLYTLNLPHETRHTHIHEVIEVVFTMWYNCVYIATVPHVQGTFANVMSIQHPWGREWFWPREGGDCTIPTKLSEWDDS